MAKLDNVKVVNENTVEYNGFVYTLVTGDAKVDDIVKASEQELDVTEGAFYLVVDIDYDDDIVFKDNVDDSNYFSQGEPSVFRKSHAITDDKLTDAEGVVTITLPDGTKLEGTPSDLEKITRSMQALQNEQQGQAEQVGVSTKDNPAETVEVEDASEPVAERLQVGDYAKVIKSRGDRFVGLIVELTKKWDGEERFNVTPIIKSDMASCYVENMVRATDEEVLEAKQALLKEGDFARIIDGENTEDVCGPHKFEVGTVLKLHEFDSDDNTFETRYLNGDTPDAEWVHRKDLEPLTAEEAEHIAREAEEEKKAKAERAKWAAIGREVGELRDGDVVQFTESTGTSEFPEDSVAIITNVSGDEFNFGEDDVYDGDSAWVKLIVPVEQRFDTVG